MIGSSAGYLPGMHSAESGAIDDDQVEATDNETPEEFAEELESDPSRNPDDPEWEAVKGG